MDLTRFRELLTKNILKKNPSKHLTADELDEVVQRIIDRLIFIRTLEDKELEAPVLQSLIREDAHKRLYKKLNAQFRKIDDIYNSKLFQEHECEFLEIDDDVLEKVIYGLFSTSDKTVHYDFSAIDADVLGNIYEQYLGHILKKTEKRAKLSEGKAHRKEQGIYYTPTYIVDYIVKNTVGELAKNKKFDLSKIKILDPACGSGSFLMKAFDYLVTLDKKKNGDIEQTKLDTTGTTATYGKKLEILKNNIFGVDLDAKAVEIAQLNLLLKAAEKKHRLPTLQENIKIGNSLIDDESVAKDKAFKWHEQFKEIMDNGGFDVVIGNPPYVRIQTLQEIDVNYFNANYTSATKNYDIYALFVEKGFSLLKDGGLLGFILPSKFLNAEYGIGLRKYISENSCLSKLVDFQDFQVFDNATTYTCLLFLKKVKNKKLEYIEVDNKKIIHTKLLEASNLKKSKQNQPQTEDAWNFFSEDSKELIKKLEKVHLKLSDISSELFVGLQTSADPIYIVQILQETGDYYEINCRKTNKKYKVEREVIKPILMGKDIRKWSINWRKLGLIFPYRITDKKAVLIEEEEYKKLYPMAWAYFVDNKKFLDLREKGKWKNRKNWHAYVYEKNLSSFSQPKILTQVLSSKNSFTLDVKGRFYFVGGGNAGGYGITFKDKYSENKLSILGILNSRLLEFYLKKISTPFRGGYYSYGKRFIEKLPIKIDNKLILDKISKYSKRQLELNESIAPLQNKHTDEKAHLEKEIEQLDREIDEEVYKLYGITKEEKKVIEDSLKS